MAPNNIKINVIYDGVDITDEIQNSISALTYTDNSKNAIDDLEIIVENLDGRWFNEWFPDMNARLSVGLIQTRNGDETFLDLGTFYVDEPTFTPNRINLKCVAIPLNEGLRQQINSSAWEKITLSELLNQIAKKHNLDSLLLAKNIFFERLDQDRETDLAFLTRIISEQAFSLKLTNDTIVIFDDWDIQENEVEIEIFTLNDNRIRDYSMHCKNQDVFDCVQISYYDADKKQHITETITKEELQNRNEVKVDE